MESTQIAQTLCGNREKYVQIIEWICRQLESVDKRLSFDSLLFISGDPGIGKTMSIQKIGAALDLHIDYITTSTCGSSDELNDLIIKCCSSSMIQVLLNDKRKKIIVIDEFDSMMALDRTINLTIYNILNGKIFKSNSFVKALRNIPIICITSPDILKRIGTLKKKCIHIALEKPTVDDIFKLLAGLHPEKHSKELLDIAKHSEGNISQALENAMINDSYDKIDVSYDISILYHTTFDREKLRKVVLSDQWLIPLKYHENMMSELAKRKILVKQAKTYYKTFMMNLLHYDILMYNNCVDQAVDTFCSITYELTKYPCKKNMISAIDNFTKILSYLSLQRKNTKNAYTGLYQVGSYHTNIVGRNYMFFK